ncbi:hypothetical protein AAFF_G00371750 [Aldrovandia affinis]|uniref:Uncharacterized protein n=1 Tax=Aldrovandia affinis TaxID=143900 RepID=A0AAD7SGZ9_9TELE|nr:hypothetical protein AAFF_G00371750 [Aldrovandia affinis]
MGVRRTRAGPTGLLFILLFFSISRLLHVADAQAQGSIVVITYTCWSRGAEENGRRDADASFSQAEPRLMGPDHSAPHWKILLGEQSQGQMEHSGSGSSKRPPVNFTPRATCRVLQLLWELLQ